MQQEQPRLTLFLAEPTMELRVPVRGARGSNSVPPTPLKQASATLVEPRAEQHARSLLVQREAAVAWFPRAPLLDLGPEGDPVQRVGPRRHSLDPSVGPYDDLTVRRAGEEVAL